MLAVRQDDLVRARKDLRDAAESLAGAWAALRSAGEYHLAQPIVSILTEVKGLSSQVPDGEVGHDPADWYLKN